jgi:catechol 2,3-dioxygenase-like lactoylglutathione lyase family enzyme
MKNYGLIEVILYVKDMNKMVRFYRDVLDLPLTNLAASDHTNENWITFESGNCLLALHSGGKGNIGTDAPKIVFRVQDIKSARFQLLESGVTAGEIRSPAPGFSVCDAKDPEGNLFSIEEQTI